jgi:hypothetical protein
VVFIAYKDNIVAEISFFTCECNMDIVRITYTGDDCKRNFVLIQKLGFTKIKPVDFLKSETRCYAVLTTDLKIAVM